MVSMSIGHNIIQLDNQQLDHVYYQNAHQCLTSSNHITSVERPKDKHINGVSNRVEMENSPKNLEHKITPKNLCKSRLIKKIIHTNFGGCDLSGFGDKITFQNWPNFPFRPWTI